MKNYQEEYAKAVKKCIKLTYNDFFFNIRLHLLRCKTTDSKLPTEHIIKRAVDKMWEQFIKDCDNPKIGIDRSIEKAFSKHSR